MSDPAQGCSMTSSDGAVPATARHRACDDVTVPSGPSSRWARIAVLFGPPLVYAAIAAGYFSTFLQHPRRGVPGGADGILYTWYFEWVEKSVVHLHNPFVSHAMNAPYGLNLMWNTAVLLLALLCIPITATLGPIVAVGLMMVLAPIASASTCYWVLKRMTGRWWTSAFISLLYGFSPFFAGQQGHLHLSVAVFPPLVLLFGYELLIEQRRGAVRTGLLLGISVGLQMLISEETVVLTLVVLVASVVVLAVFDPRRAFRRARVRHLVFGTVVAGVIAVVICGVPLAYQFFGPYAPSGIIPNHLSVDIAALVRPGQLQYFADHADIAANNRYTTNVVENTGYLGWPIVILVVGLSIYYMIRRDRFGYWWLLTAAASVIVSLGSPVTFNGSVLGRGPWAGLRKLPLLDSVVAPRFSVITILLVAFILARWLGSLRGRALVVGAVVAAASLVPLVPAGPYGEISVVQTPRFFATSAVTVLPEGSPTLVLPYASGPNPAGQVMAWQVKAHLRFNLIGGYSVFKLDGQMSYVAFYPRFGTLLSDVGQTGKLPGPLQIALAQPGIRMSKVRNIVIVTALQPDAALVVRAAELVTGCTARQVADVTVCTVPST